jgi:predicted ATPase
MGSFRFSVKNFRNVDPDTIFDFAPISLLIGPNNSGKSSVLKSLMLLAENSGNHLSLPKKINLSQKTMKIHGFNDILSNSDKPLEYSFYFDSPLNLLDLNSKDYFKISVSYSPYSTFETDAFERNNNLYIKEIAIFFNTNEILRFEYLAKSIIVDLKFNFNNLLSLFSQELNKIIGWDNDTLKKEDCSLIDLLNYKFDKNQSQQYRGDFKDSFEPNPSLDYLTEVFKQELSIIVKDLEINKSNYPQIKDFFLDNTNLSLIDLINIPFYKEDSSTIFKDHEGFKEYFGQKLNDFQAYINEVFSVEDTVIKESCPEILNILVKSKFDLFKKSHYGREYTLIDFNENGISHHILFAIHEIKHLINEIGFDYLRSIANYDIDGFGVGYDSYVVSPSFNYISQTINKSLIETWINLVNLNVIPPIKYNNNTFFSLSNPTSTLGETLRAYGRIVSYSNSSFHLTDDYTNLIHENFLSEWLTKFSIGKSLKLNPTDHPFENDIFAAYIESNDGQLINISNMGTGVSQILALMLLPYFALEKHNQTASEISFEIPKNKYIFYLEEPETNLHPNWQSLLLELITDMHKKFGLHFIIETHSEYMIRKLQYLTASINSELSTEESVIYYMSAQDTLDDNKVKKIRIDKLGNLSDIFGSGFYDEAINLKFDLIKLNKTQLN